MNSVSGVTGAAAQGNPAAGLGASQSGGLKEEFLTLLVTQLKQQDPLNPQDGQQFVAQLAQFSTLESMKNVESAMGDLSIAGLLQANTQSASFIGRDVLVAGDSFDYSGKGQVEMGYVVDGKAEEVQIEILDADGNVVDTIQKGAQSGEQTFKWGVSSRDEAGPPAGKYTLRITAKDADGNEVGVPETRVRATVESIRFVNNIAHYVLSNGDEALLGQLREMSGGG